MDTKIKDILNNAEYYTDSEKCLLKIMKKKLSIDKIKEILDLENKLIAGAFLTKYQHFDDNDLKYMEQYILDNLDHENKMFVSDLIEFATCWELQLPYRKCIEFLTVHKEDNTYVQLSAIDYIFENLKFSYILEIVKALQEILDSKEMNNSLNPIVQMAQER